MTVYGSERILFILCFLCFTSIKNSAKPPITKITDSDQQNRFPIVSLLMKPFQASETKKVDMEDFQINTLEWVQKRLMLFIQNLDTKILYQYKPDRKSKVLEKAPDKRTAFSLQWQDMKSHFLIPMAKKHIRVYTLETINKLEKVKLAFFKMLKLYTIKLINLEKDKAIDVKTGYNVKKKSFDREKDLAAERTMLHNEMYALLDDLPTILMFWSPEEIHKLKRFAEIYGELPEPKNESEDDFGEDDEETVTFGGGNFIPKWKHEKTKHSDSDESSDSSSSSSSSDCFTDHDSDFFDKLTKEDFLSEEENEHSGEPGEVNPSLQHDSLPRPSPSPLPSPPTPEIPSDDEERRRLRTLDGNGIDWDREAALARERQFRSMGPERIDETDQELIELRNKLLWSLTHNPTGDEESKKQLEERDPNILNDIERYRKTHQNRPISHSSHTPGSPSHNSSGEHRSGDSVDNSTHDQPIHGRSTQVSPPSPPPPHHDLGESGGSSSTHERSPQINPHPPSPVDNSERNPRSPPKPPRSHSGVIEKPPSWIDRSEEPSAASYVGKTVHLDIRTTISVAQKQQKS